MCSAIPFSQWLSAVNVPNGVELLKHEHTQYVLSQIVKLKRKYDYNNNRSSSKLRSNKICENSSPSFDKVEISRCRAIFKSRRCTENVYKV